MKPGNSFTSHCLMVSDSESVLIKFCNSLSEKKTYTVNAYISVRIYACLSFLLRTTSLQERNVLPLILTLE